MAKKKKDKPEEGRDRIDMRMDPAMLARVQRQANRFGITLTAYIKLSLSRQLEADEREDRR